MRLDDISDSESVDVILEASGEGAGCLLAADLGKCVPRTKLENTGSCDLLGGLRVFWINIVVFL